MSDSKDRCEECSGHEKCGERCGHGFDCNKCFFFVRWTFGLIILAIVFCVGVSVGHFTGQVDSGSYGSGYGWSRMMNLDDSNYGYGSGMMRGWVIQAPAASTQTTAPATKTAK